MQDETYLDNHSSLECNDTTWVQDGTYLDNHNGKYVYGEMAGLYKVDMPATIYERSEAIAAAAGQKFSISDTLPVSNNFVCICSVHPIY